LITGGSSSHDVNKTTADRASIEKNLIPIPTNLNQKLKYPIVFKNLSLKITIL
jgi:hypothetical protein